MPRLAYQAQDEADFYNKLDRLMDIAARSLATKRKVVTGLLEQGLYPYTKRYLGTFGNHFSTIGLVGMNEAGLNAKWLRADMTDERVQEFSRNVLNHMRDRLSDYQEQYGDLYNLEATPAESTTYRFAKHDKEEFPEIITANMNGNPYYTNSSHLPVGYTEDVFSALDIQDNLQTLYTSGTVFHAFLGEKLPDWKAAANLVRKIAENYKLPYYTMSPTYSVCKDHGYLVGEQYTCPHCGAKTEVYSRITGYYRPVQNWNEGKAQEFKDRLTYNIGHSVLTHQGPNPAPADLPHETISVSGNLAEAEPVPADHIAAKAAAEAQAAAAPRMMTNADAALEAAMEAGCCAPVEPMIATDEQIEAAKAAAASGATAILFKTPTCPNCKAAGALLDKAGIAYQALNANEEKELVEKYGVKQAPTLVLVDGDNFEKYRGVSDIKGWLMNRQ